MNGAYNIIRKVVPKFGVSDTLSSQFVLMWLAPTGLKKFKADKYTNLSREWDCDERVKNAM